MDCSSILGGAKTTEQKLDIRSDGSNTTVPTGMIYHIRLAPLSLGALIPRRPVSTRIWALATDTGYWIIPAVVRSKWLVNHTQPPKAS